MKEMEECTKQVGAGAAFQLVTAFIEILLVAVAGSFLTQLAFILFGVPAGQIMSSTSLVLIFMTTEASITLLIILALLNLRRENLQTLGWIWKNPRKEMIVGLATIPILFASTLAVSVFFRSFFPVHVSTTNPLLELIKNNIDLVLFIISSIYVGGCKEEIQRAFILDRFGRYIGRGLHRSLAISHLRDEKVKGKHGQRLGLIVGLFIWSLFFGIGHAVQGIDNAVGAGVLGLLFGLLLIWRRNLMAPMLAHALYNITTLIIFWGPLGG